MIPPSRRIPIAIFVGSCLLAGLFFHIWSGQKCSMEANLMPLFTYFLSQLTSINAQYWIDYGTLLGGIREGQLLAHEFDLDMAAQEEACPAIIAGLKEKMKAEGYPSYEQGEWIEQKYNRFLGHDGFLHKPCFRVYDKAHDLYVDIDWYRTYTSEQVQAIQAVANGEAQLDDEAIKKVLPDGFIMPKRAGGLDLPREWYDDTSKSVLCNEEGIDGGDPGGCRLAEWMLPLKPFTFPKYDLATLVPQVPEKNLEAMYGSDWMVPHGKGYKAIVCSWFPVSGFAITILLLLTLTLPSLIFIATQHIQKYGFRMPSSAPVYQLVNLQMNDHRV